MTDSTPFISEIWGQECLATLDASLEHYKFMRRILGGEMVILQRWFWMPKWFPGNSYREWKWDEGRGPSEVGDVLRISQVDHLTVQ